MIFFRFMHDATKAVLIACLLWLVLPAYADSPPVTLLHEIVSTTEVVRQGRCDVESMGIADQLCIVRGESDTAGWIVLFDDDTEPRMILRVVITDGVATETVAWCRKDVCK